MNDASASREAVRSSNESVSAWIERDADSKCRLSEFSNGLPDVALGCTLHWKRSGRGVLRILCSALQLSKTDEGRYAISGTLHLPGDVISSGHGQRWVDFKGALHTDEAGESRLEGRLPVKIWTYGDMAKTDASPTAAKVRFELLPLSTVPADAE